MRHRKPGLAGAGGPDAEHHLVALAARMVKSCAKVRACTCRLRRLMVSNAFLAALGSNSRQSPRDHGADRALDITRPNRPGTARV
jgi:hypothetical protein